ncbi:unnamed protein product [Rotaria sp. Silwood1]|nr:unnamed protein product [Rotaria sp. Silwood1]CAF1685537.1 unnamed protein product [Rotaria sp. Silwood1]
MINEGVHIIHGHSSHHIRGVEIVQRQNGTRSLITYGCGDFLADYVIDEDYRNNLGALFQVHLTISPSSSPQDGKLESIRLQSLRSYPTPCLNFQVNRLSLQDVDWSWIKGKFMQLSNISGKLWTVDHNSDILLDIST